MQKRKRATQKQIQERKAACIRFATEQSPVTVRGVYYHCTTLGLVPKTESGYRMIQRACKQLRLDGELEWKHIADNSRWMRRTPTFNSMEDALIRTAKTYRRDFLSFADCQIEVWCEKDALSGVFSDVCFKWDVPLFVSGGFSSLTFLHQAAQNLREGAHIYIFSDYDAAGVSLSEKISERLREFSDKEINVHRAMLDKAQVESLALPTREPKSNDKKQGFAFCAELDAIPPNTLRAHVEQCITQHVNKDELATLRRIEHEEKESMREIFRYLNV